MPEAMVPPARVPRAAPLLRRAHVTSCRTTIRCLRPHAYYAGEAGIRYLRLSSVDTSPPMAGLPRLLPHDADRLPAVLGGACSRPMRRNGDVVNAPLASIDN